MPAHWAGRHSFVQALYLCYGSGPATVAFSNNIPSFPRLTPPAPPLLLQLPELPPPFSTAPPRRPCQHGQTPAKSRLSFLFIISCAGPRATLSYCMQNHVL